LSAFATIVECAAALVVILLGAAFFTNVLENPGGRLGLQQEAVGSPLAAVGTALPESMIATMAIMEPVVAGEASKESVEIGVGVIPEAPFRLATLALFAVGACAGLSGFSTWRSWGGGLSQHLMREAKRR